MTFDAERIKIDRKPVLIVEMDLDFCGNDYGNSPCAASGTTKCFNTYFRCQDQINYTPTTKTYRFVENLSSLPQLDWLPFIDSYDLSASKKDPGKSLGRREQITINFKDLPYDDIGIDPYVSERTYNPIDQGSFFGKFLARNKYYNGRVLRTKIGYLTDDMTDFTNFETRTYFIEEMRIDKEGSFTVIAKDILKLADRAQAPVAAFSELDGSITAVATTITSADATSYDASGAIRINDEIISYTGTTSTTFTGCSRGQYGTTANNHEDEDAIQQCVIGTNENVVDTVKKLLEDYAAIDSSYIPFTDWQAVAAEWLQDYDLTYVLSKPEKVTNLINELCEQCQLIIGWDSKESEVILNAVVPDLSQDIFITQENTKEKSLILKDDARERVSRVVIHYGLVDYSDKVEFENTSFTYASIDTDSESSLTWGEVRTKEIISRWFDSTNAQAILTTGGRLANAKRDNQTKVSFVMDVADNEPGAEFFLKHPSKQNDDGTPETTSMYVVSRKEMKAGSQIRFDAVSTGYKVLRYAAIGPNTLLDYNNESVSNRSKYGFISQNSAPFFSDNSDAYRII